MADLILSDLQSSSESPFDLIRRYDADGNEFWTAREVLGLLGYKSWRRQKDTVERAIVSCKNSGQDSTLHFAEVVQMVQIGGSEACRSVLIDYNLSRLACYLVAMNGDPRKEEIAMAQSYFAVKTREAEIAQQPVEAIDPIDALIRGLEETKRVRAELEAVKQQVALEAQRIDAVEELTHQLDSEMERIHKPYGDYYTAMGFLRLKGFTNISMAQAQAIGAKAAKRCKELGIEIEKMRDPRFGTVGAYPHAILEEVC